MRISTEPERQSEAIRYVQDRICNLRTAIRLCDYAEDPYGNLVYEPGSYPEEKQMLSESLREWEKLLYLLMGQMPFDFHDR